MSLTLHSEPIAKTSAGVPAIGLRRFVVRDSAGAVVDVEWMAWGQVGTEIAGLFPGGIALTGERTDEDVIARDGVTLDAGAEYLLLLVRCEGAVRDG